MSTGRGRKKKLAGEVTDALRRHSGKTVFLHAAVADHLGLGLTDHKCVDLLVQGGPMTAGELAVKARLTTGAITGVIDRLERAGYVVRAADPADRRRVVVEPVREKLMSDFGPVFEGIARATASLLEKYTEDQLELILDFLKRAADLCDEEAERLGGKR